MQNQLQNRFRTLMNAEAINRRTRLNVPVSKAKRTTKLPEHPPGVSALSVPSDACRSNHPELVTARTDLCSNRNHAGQRLPENSINSLVPSQNVSLRPGVFYNPDNINWPANSDHKIQPLASVRGLGRPVEGGKQNIVLSATTVRSILTQPSVSSNSTTLDDGKKRDSVSIGDNVTAEHILSLSNGQISKLTHQQIRNACRGLRLKFTGSKDDCIGRLQQSAAFLTR